MDIITPVNLYYHSNKQEWRARYIDNGIKKAKHFSSNRYNSKVAYFLGNVYMRLIADYNEVPTNDEIVFWLNITRYFKSLNFGKYSDFNGTLTSRLQYIDYERQEFIQRVINDVDKNTFVSEQSLPFIPSININDLKKNATELYEYMKKLKSNNNNNTTSYDTTKVSNDSKQKITLNFILDTILNKTHSIKRKRSYIDDYIKVLRDINDNELKNVLGSINEFHSEDFYKDEKYIVDEDEQKSKSTYRNDEDDHINVKKSNQQSSSSSYKSNKSTKFSMGYLIKLVKRHEDIIQNMSNGDSKYHKQSLTKPVASFNDGCLVDDDNDVLSYLYSRPYIKNNSLYDFSNLSYMPKLNTNKDQSSRLEDDLELYDEKKIKPSEYRKLCNEKLQSLIEQTEMIDDYNVFSNVIRKCIDDESKAMSDLESLIQISNRFNRDEGNDNKDEATITHFGNRLHNIQENYSNKHITVRYINGRIIPTSTMHLQEDLNDDQGIFEINLYNTNTDRISLSGRDKMDINFELLSKHLSRTKGSKEYIDKAIESIQLIDDKIELITKEYETMHKALYKYLKSDQRDITCTNDLEEMLNLEMLHMICETLNDTKLKLIQQMYNNIEAQINIINSIMPIKYYKVFNEILYGSQDK